MVRRDISCEGAIVESPGHACIYDNETVRMPPTVGHEMNFEDSDEVFDICSSV